MLYEVITLSSTALGSLPFATPLLGFLALDPEAADEFHDLVKGGVAAAQKESYNFV